MKDGTAGAKVEKALSPDEKALIGDVRALLDKLEQIEEAEPEEEAEQMEPAGEDEEENLFAAAMKAAQNLGIEGAPMEDGGSKAAKATANDKADARVEEDEPKEGKEALAMLGKALTELIHPRRKVQKSAQAELLEGLVGVVSKLASQVQDTNRAVTGILEGMGVADVIKSAAPARTVVQAPHNNALVNALVEAIQKSAVAAPAAEPNTDGSRASLGSAMAAIAAAGPTG
jgi:hypothetical protein